MTLRARWAALPLLLAVGLGGCGQPAPPPELIRVVVVTAPTAEQPQPRLTVADQRLIGAAADTDAATLHVLVAGDPAAGIRIDLTPRRHTGGGRSPVEHGPAREEQIDATVRRVEEALAGLAPASGEPDLLRAITDATRMGPAGTMIVADSGVTTVDPLDLAELGWDRDPAEVVTDLAERGFLPELAGWAVRFTALGRVTGAQEELPAPQQRWLEDLWLRLCAEAGARSCTVEPGDDVPTAPSSTRHAPPVPVPAVTTMTGADGTVVSTLPASRLGFTEGSAALPADADGALADVVALGRGGRYAVEVAGYVAYWGTPDYRSRLAAARAEAVAARIMAAGVPAGLVTAVGRGAADGPEASRTGGVFDEAKVRAAGLRRVVVTLRPLP